ncbi:MAG TPA: acyltransferase, partial [Opitutaceae bacterium]
LELASPVKGRVLALDELKGLAILMIAVLYHAAGVLSMNDVVHGEVGVDMFVILSGIGLALGSQDGSTGRYLVRRLMRIYPAYWVVLTACVVAGVTLNHQSYSAWDVILHYTGMHVWFGDAHAMSINDSFWFITLIVSLYLVYAPLRKFADRPDIILFAGAVMSFTCASIYLHYGQSACFGHFSLRMPGFFVGLVIGRLMRTGSLEIRPTPYLGAAGLLIFYIPYVMSYIFTSPWIGCGVIAGYAFLLRQHTPEAVRKVLRFLGDHSLEIFLIHQPLIREYNVWVIGHYFPHAGVTTTSLTLGMAVGLAVTIAVSVPLHALMKRVATLGSAPRAAARPDPTQDCP